jgi:uncharacterized membrane protein
VVSGEEMGTVGPVIKDREVVTVGDCIKIVRLESSSVVEKRPALFQRASSATLISALTSASIRASLEEKKEYKMFCTEDMLKQEDKKYLCKVKGLRLMSKDGTDSDRMSVSGELQAYKEKTDKTKSKGCLSTSLLACGILLIPRFWKTILVLVFCIASLGSPWFGSGSP